MLKAEFDLKRHHQVVIYVRMSTDQQNPRSPEQQIATIRETIARLGLNWTIVKTYRAEGISGRYTKKRPGLQEMLGDLKSRRVQADLVLVDTFERLSRSDDSAELRRKLRLPGALVLTADSQFADPTNTSGQVLAAFESVRAAEEGRVKAHNVLRGKKDAVRLKHWPGGPVPIGYRLRNVMIMKKGMEEVDYRELVPAPEARWIIEKVFRLADEKGWGGTRLAQHLNADEQIDDKYKPLSATTITTWLANEIYIGTLVWGRNCTGIVDDVRILQPLPESDWERIEEFCEPLITTEVWNRVQEMRLSRRRRSKSSGAIEATSPPVTHTATGIALVYPLSGLVRCAACQRAMVASSSSPYITTAGEERRYVAYVCPASHSDVCENDCRVPEDWLRETVVNLIRKRLFLTDDSPSEPDSLLENPMFQELVTAVHEEVDRQRPGRQHRQASLTAENEELQQQRSGWLQTLGNPRISSAIRSAVEAQFDQSEARLLQIEAELSQLSATLHSEQQVVDPNLVAERLRRLSEVLAGQNASATNLILSQHIDGIFCSADGRVVVRTCKLGCLAGALDVMPRQDEIDQSPETENPDTAKPRKRTRRDVADAISDEDFAEAVNDFAVDPDRFAGLGPEWFHFDTFEVPRRLSWSEENAKTVAEFRLTKGATMEVTAEHFGRTVPTIRRALEYARYLHGINALGTSISLSTRSTWPQRNAEAVLEFFQAPGATMRAAVEYFEKSEPTILKARRLAESSLTAN